MELLTLIARLSCAGNTEHISFSKGKNVFLLIKKTSVSHCFVPGAASIDTRDIFEIDVSITAQNTLF